MGTTGVDKSVPTVIFIDTNVFDKLHYNFNTVAAKAFTDACRSHGFVLLLPPPMESEVLRHIPRFAAEMVQRYDKAVKSVSAELKKSPALSAVEAIASAEPPAPTPAEELAQLPKNLRRSEWASMLNFECSRARFELQGCRLAEAIATGSRGQAVRM
jgi:predicted nucleic acid-binding protein